jgi:hypothetical protein
MSGILQACILVLFLHCNAPNYVTNLLLCAHFLCRKSRVNLNLGMTQNYWILRICFSSLFVVDTSEFPRFGSYIN